MRSAAVVYIPIEVELFADLVARYGTSDPTKAFRVVSEVVSDFLERTEGAPGRQDPAKGLYWQDLFLPDGSKLRITIRGKQYFSEVAGGQLRYEGKTFTPAGWANFVAGHARNAWRDIYVMRPAENSWVFAASLRRGRGTRYSVD